MDMLLRNNMKVQSINALCWSRLFMFNYLASSVAAVAMVSMSLGGSRESDAGTREGMVLHSIAIVLGALVPPLSTSYPAGIWLISWLAALSLAIDTYTEGTTNRACTKGAASG
jgi:hypothetical protein